MEKKKKMENGRFYIHGIIFFLLSQFIFLSLEGSEVDVALVISGSFLLPDLIR